MRRAHYLMVLAATCGLTAIGCIDRESGKAPPASVADKRAQPAPGCRAVAATKAPRNRRFPGQPDENVRGFALRSVQLPIPAEGKWVGTVERPATDGSVQAGRPFQMIAAGDTGCLYFKDTGVPINGGVRAAVALYYPDLDRDPEPLNGIICRGNHEGPHDPNTAEPDWKTSAERCQNAKQARLTIVAGDTVLSVGVSPDTTIAFDVRLDALRDSLIAPGGAAPFAATIAAVFAAAKTAGPWFPCELNGCCRAF